MPSTNVAWDRLHDAILISVSMEWASGDACARVRLSEEPARTAEIHVRGSTLLRCPRVQPWGPSVSINEVRVLSRQDERIRLEIEVQSGDVVEIEGDVVELTLTGE